MNLDELRTVQSKERSKDSLQHLRESFYADVATYIQSLRDEREEIAAEVDDPWDSADISRLSDEIETAEEVVEALYERRVGKVVKRASIAAAGMPVDEGGLTSEEQELYDDLVSRIRANKGRVLDILGGEIPPETPSADADTEAEPAPDGPSEGVSAADAMGDAGRDPSPADDGAADRPKPSPDGAEDATPTPTPPPETPDPETPDDAAGGDGIDRRTVRITRDIGDIFGVDEREYTLSREDVVTLPAANADPLVERDAAEPLDQ